MTAPREAPLNIDDYLRGAVDMAKVIYPERWGLPPRRLYDPARYYTFSQTCTDTTWRLITSLTGGTP